MVNFTKEFEKERDNTYGIEIEFGTHDSQILSFTHIEVCSFGQKDIPDSFWKIETDADYTLELVSPILFFNDPKVARTYRNNLMEKLDEWVSKGISLEDLVDYLDTYIIGQFKYDAENKHMKYQEPKEIVESSISYITSGELFRELDWHNWDEDTNLPAVLAAKEYFQGGKKAKPFSDLRVENMLKDVFISSSSKHGGLPSSQLNVPHQLTSYVTYDILKKNAKSWDRLLETEVATTQYKNEQIEKLLQRYPRLIDDPNWMAKYGHPEYIEMMVEEKTPIWHRYWLWENVFFICATVLTLEKWDIDATKQPNYPGYTIIRSFLESTELNESNIEENLKELRLEVEKYIDTSLEEEYLAYFDITYLAVQKIITGAFSTLSEEKQGYAQRLLFRFDGEVGMETITDGIADSEFLQFHYALKDLTSLWFKSPLVDVISQEVTMYSGKEYAKQILDAKQDIQDCDPNAVSLLFENVLTGLIEVLGRYVGLREANNTGYEYEWEDFKSYNMPSVLATVRRFRVVLAELKAYFAGDLTANQDIVVSLENPPGGYNPPEFLGREYVNPLNNHTIPIASWEGRWDTLKKPIKAGDEPPRYLIEHRNN